MQIIHSRGLSGGSLYKLLFIGLLVPLFIIGLAAGIASYFGHATVTINGEHLFGIKGLIAGIVIGLVLPVLMAALYWVFIGFGLWVWTRARRITLKIKE